MHCVEVRGFGCLMKLFEERKWPFPLKVHLDKKISGAELAKKLDIPLDQIEIVFVNGRARTLEQTVKPGDRVAFVPPGTPGPYRVLLGFVRKGNGKE
ncbi:MAG TPA: MoaD/ThiS family protein [Bacillota bacterium]|nr:MoaD/ThiS family protein [Bacillota bacterium]